MKYLKKFLLLVVILIPMTFITINVQAASFYNDIKQEVSNYVTSGDLPEWHNNLAGDTGYQTLYTKMVRTSNMLSYFKTIPEDELRLIIQWYHTNSDNVWEDVIKSLISSNNI